MIPRSLRRALQSGRPPRPTATIKAEQLPSAAPAVSIGIGQSLNAALSLLSLDLTEPLLLIPYIERYSNQSLRDVVVVSAWLAAFSEISLGLPAWIDSSSAQQWRAAVQPTHGRIVSLGQAGWNRVDFGDRSLILEHADLPAELFGGAQALLLSRPTGNGCLAGWAALAHPNSGLRARAAGNASVELSLGVPAGYLLIGEDDGQTVVVHATTPIVAELAARAIERLAQRRRGAETIGPWEEPSVQHLAELGGATTAVTQLVVQLAVTDNAGARTGRAIAEVLGWGVHLITTAEENDR